VSTPLAVDVLDLGGRAEWDALVAASAHGSPYATTTYLDALAAATGGSYRVLVARKGDDIAGGVALFEETTANGRRIAPRPLLFYNGVVLREHPTKYPSQRTSRLLETTAALEAAIRESGPPRVALRHRHTLDDVRAFVAGGWSARPGYTYVVDLTDMKAAWERVEQNLRRLVNRCVGQGMVLTDDDDFDSYFRMHDAQAERKGTERYLAQGAFRTWFATLHAAGLCRLFHARLPSGESISAQLVLTGPHRVSHSVTAAADAAYLNSGATAFLRWKVFERLAELGYAANDLTDAALNPVTHFKSQLGGELAVTMICERATPSQSLGERVAGKVRSYLGAR
jgi:hypothetical protein